MDGCSGEATSPGKAGMAHAAESSCWWALETAGAAGSSCRGQPAARGSPREAAGLLESSQRAFAVVFHCVKEVVQVFLRKITNFEGLFTRPPALPQGHREIRVIDVWNRYRVFYGATPVIGWLHSLLFFMVFISRTRATYISICYEKVMRKSISK